MVLIQPKLLLGVRVTLISGITASHKISGSMLMDLDLFPHAFLAKLSLEAAFS